MHARCEVVWYCRQPERVISRFLRTFGFEIRHAIPFQPVLRKYLFSYCVLPPLIVTARVLHDTLIRKVPDCVVRFLINAHLIVT